MHFRGGCATCLQLLCCPGEWVAAVWVTTWLSAISQCHESALDTAAHAFQLSCVLWEECFRKKTFNVERGFAGMCLMRFSFGNVFEVKEGEA